MVSSEGAGSEGVEEGKGKGYGDGLRWGWCVSR